MNLGNDLENIFNEYYRDIEKYNPHIVLSSTNNGLPIAYSKELEMTTNKTLTTNEHISAYSSESMKYINKLLDGTGKDIKVTAAIYQSANGAQRLAVAECLTNKILLAVIANRELTLEKILEKNEEYKPKILEVLKKYEII